MSTAGQFSSKNPTIKRILKEASELANQPSLDYHAAPLETDLFEWHFTIRGPPAPSPFEGGIYHGRIVLPPAYPLKPPSFRFLTPTGRFEVNREICLSISGHHEETWQPAWGIRTALVAIRSFMDTDAKGQLGGMDSSAEVRKRMAGQSPAWKCSTCGQTNEALMQEQEAAVKSNGGEGQKEEVPEELRLAYREDLAKDSNKPEGAETSSEMNSSSPAVETKQIDSAQSNEKTTSTSSTTIQPNPPPPTSQAAAAQQQQARANQNDAVPAWIDKAIYCVIIALMILLCRKLAS